MSDTLPGFFDVLSNRLWFRRRPCSSAPAKAAAEEAPASSTHLRRDIGLSVRLNVEDDLRRYLEWRL